MSTIRLVLWWAMLNAFRVSVVVAVLVLACVVAPKVRAAESLEDQGKAYARCVEWKDYYQGVYGSSYTWSCHGPLTQDANTKYYETCARNPDGSDTCPAGSYQNVFYFPAASTCGARPETHSVLTWPAGVNVTGGNVCVGGCEAYRTDGTQGTDAEGNTGFVGMLHYTDTVCAASADSPASTVGDEDEECIPVEGMTMCHNMATGEKCAIASTGKKFCWTAGDTSPKTATDGTQAADRANSPEAPTPPEPVTDWTESQSATTSDTTTTSGTPTTTTQTTTVYNNTGDDSGEEGGGDDGGGDTEGEGGESECTGAGSDCTNAGDAGEGLGELYEESDDTVDSVMTSVAAQIQSTPVFSAAVNFIGADCGLSGSCPVIEWDAGEFFVLNSDVFCSDTLTMVLGWASYVMLAMAALAAFRVAFDH